MDVDHNNWYEHTIDQAQSISENKYITHLVYGEDFKLSEGEYSSRDCSEATETPFPGSLSEL